MSTNTRRFNTVQGIILAAGVGIVMWAGVVSAIFAVIS